MSFTGTPDSTLTVAGIGSNAHNGCAGLTFHSGTYNMTSGIGGAGIGAGGYDPLVSSSSSPSSVGHIVINNGNYHSTTTRGVAIRSGPAEVSNSSVIQFRPTAESSLSM
jgi:hypothetical protein